MSDVRIFGLDGEMSGSDLDKGHRLIQIGVAVDTAADGARLPRPELFCSLIGWAEEDLVWDDRAAQVHNIPREAVLAAPRAVEVDAALADWLGERGASAANRRVTVMCGFNVGAFDAPFVVDALPVSASMFARRYADLNPLTFLMPAARQVLGGPADERAWKRHLKRVGMELVRQTGRVEAEHDAGTDALLALGAWRGMEQLVAGLDADAATARRAARSIRKAMSGLST